MHVTYLIWLYTKNIKNRGLVNSYRLSLNNNWVKNAI